FTKQDDGDPSNDLTPDEAAKSLILGLAGEVGNGIDEFTTNTLRNQLLGLPLDLATINMTRARETGTPSLQEARAAFFAQTLDPLLEPYASWEDFRLELKHRDSIVNFVAAYGTGDAGHAGDAGGTYVAGDDVANATVALANIPQGDATARRARAGALVADPAYMDLPAAQVGLNDVDFWIGGLAERTMIFGGMLGSTFNHVFETQAELLQ